MLDAVLIALWVCSLGLAGLSLGLFAVMVLRRWLGAFWRTRSAGLATELAETLVAQMEPGAVPSARLEALTRHPRRTALAVIELSAIVRGRDFERAMAVLREAGAVRRVARLLERPGLDTRLIAIEALARIDGAAARRILTDTFHRGPTLRDTIAAAQALHQLGTPPELGALLERVQGHRGGAPAELANLLTEIARTDPGPLIAALDTGGLDPSLQIQIIQALARARSAKAAGALRRTQQSDTPAVRAAGIRALGRIGGKGVSATLRKAARDRDAEVRAETAEAIGRLALADLAPVLAELIGDPVWEVRLQAGLSLSRLGEAARTLLREIAAGNRDRTACHTAHMILEELQAA